MDKHGPENGSSLIAGLDCGLDHWTGVLDWITGLTFVLKLCVPHDLHPIRCAVNGSHVWLIQRNKGRGMQLLWEFCALKVGRPCNWHNNLFQGLLLTKHSFYMATFNKTMSITQPGNR